MPFADNHSLVFDLVIQNANTVCKAIRVGILVTQAEKGYFFPLKVSFFHDL